MSGFERSMIRLTTAGIIIAILTGIVFLGQLYEMISGGTQTDKLVDYAKTQAQAADEIAQASDDFTDSAKWMEEHAKDAADAMQDSVDTASENTKTIIKNAQNTTRLDQRAWVVWKGVEGTPELDKTWVVKTYFTNSGKTPAKNVRVNCALIPAKEESELDFNRTAQSEPKPTIIAPNDPTTYCPLNPLTIEKVTKDVLNIFASREKILFAYGFVTYNDIFGKEHWLTFCHAMEPDGKAWDACQGHNDTGDGKQPKWQHHKPN